MAKHLPDEKKKKIFNDVDFNTTKGLFDKVNKGGDMDITTFLTKLTGSKDDEDATSHIPVHTLEKIKRELGRTEVEKTDDGKDILKPVYKEEEKVKIIFGLLSERGINLLDTLENNLKEMGYVPELVSNINETMGRVTETLRDIAEMQYRKSKLENERVHLEIQKYKADLKKREIEIKEQVASHGPSQNNIIAVGSTAELLDLIDGKKGRSDIVVQEVSDDEEAD